MFQLYVKERSHDILGGTHWVAYTEDAADTYRDCMLAALGVDYLPLSDCECQALLNTERGAGKWVILEVPAELIEPQEDLPFIFGF